MPSHLRVGAVLPSAKIPEAEDRQAIVQANPWVSQKLAELHQNRRSDEMIGAHIALPEVKFDFTKIRDAAIASDRAKIIQQRKDSLTDAQKAAAERVRQLGGVVKSATWLVNGLIVGIPAGQIPAFESEPNFIQVSPDLPTHQGDAWDGEESTELMLTHELSNLHTNSLQYIGNSGGRTSSPTNPFQSVERRRARFDR